MTAKEKIRLLELEVENLKLRLELLEGKPQPIPYIPYPPQPIPYSPPVYPGDGTGDGWPPWRPLVTWSSNNTGI